MKNKVLKVTVAILLIIAITMADCIIVGMNLVTYALENGANSTNHANVKFAAYFKTGEEEVTQAEYEMNSNEMKLYMRVSVDTEGYFDGVITLENSNFKLKQEQLSEYISEINGNMVTLKRVRAGNVAEIEVGIEPIIEESYEEEMLSKESVLTLTGYYKDSTEKSEVIKAEKNVKLSLITPSDIETTLESKVITNKIYKIEEDNKRIVQIELNSGVIENVYPIKTTTFELSLPEAVEEIEVISKGTFATNGESDRKLEESSYEHDVENKTLRIMLENSNKDGKIVWKKDAIDSLVVTLILAEDAELEPKEYNVKSIVDFKDKTIEKEVGYSFGEEVDGIIKATAENQEEIYKGKIYSKEQREYNTVTNIEVNYANLIEGSIIEEKTTYKTDTEEKQPNIEYKTTTIQKEEIEKVLGLDGILTIRTGTQEIKITKDTQADEDGNIVITYEEGVEELQLEITKAIETGIIRLNHTKVMKEEQYSKEEIDALKYLIETTTVKYNNVQNVDYESTELKDITSDVALTGIPQTIATDVNKQIPIAITLKTNEEKYELFENPIFTLTMPEGITVDSVSSGIISASNEELIISKLEPVNSREIRVEITGQQQKYVTSNINTQINFTANISIEKLMPNKVDAIKLQYTNKGNTYELQSEPINIIASNSKIVTHLKVENYNGAVLERYSDSTLEIAGKLPIENAEIIEVPVKYTIINNYDSQIELIPVIVASYTDNQESTERLMNYANPEFSIEAGEMQVIEQTLKIPQGLYFSEKIDIKTLAEYVYSGTQYDLGNSITLETESKEGLRNNVTVEDKLQVETFAQLGDGTGLLETDEVYNEQIVTYIIEVTNISNETISNLKITNQQDNGNIYDLKEVEVINKVESLEPFMEHRYAELNTDTKMFDIKELKPGESKEIKHRVVVKKSNQSNITSANISIEADDIEEQTIQTISNTVKDSVLKVFTERALNEEVQMYGKSTFITKTTVKNLTNEDKTDLKFKIYLSDGITWNTFSKVEALDEVGEDLKVISNITYSEEENYVEIDITKIEANQEIVIMSTLYIEEIPLELTSKDEVVYVKIEDVISNNIDINVKQLQTMVTVTQSVNVLDGQKLKDGEKVVITGEIVNTGAVDSLITISDYLHEGLQIDKIILIQNNQEIDKTENDNIILLPVEMKSGETVIMTIEATINTSKIVEDTIENTITVSSTNGDTKESNVITLEIESTIQNGDEDEESKNEGEETTNPGNMDDEDSGFKDNNYNKEDDTKNDDLDNEKPGEENPDNEKPEEENPDNENSGEGAEDKEKKYTISGKVWNDINKNSKIDSNEKIQNVIVKVIDLNNNNNFLKDAKGNEIEVKTDKNGEYQIADIPKGNYNLVFKYDTTIYELKENITVKDYIIEKTNEKVAITNTINLNSNKTIDLELEELSKFDLKIDKYISKVILQTAEGTTTAEYTNKQLVREEIKSKYLSGATVLVEYTIDISNIGELTGYATEILDYLPNDMKFHSELNTQWYMGEDGNLYNTSLASSPINPGETKTLKLVLLKTMTKNNTGTTANIAEISDEMNIRGYDDINTNNNQSKAEIIVNPATGRIITYLIAVVSAIAIVVLGIYIIKKKVIK